jgi:hypothetical protein
MLFFSAGGRNVPPVGGLDVVVLTGVLPPCVLTNLAANSYQGSHPLSSNHLACVSDAFSHARASRWSDLRTITPFGPGILMAA